MEIREEAKSHLFVLCRRFLPVVGWCEIEDRTIEPCGRFFCGEAGESDDLTFAHAEGCFSVRNR